MEKKLSGSILGWTVLGVCGFLGRVGAMEYEPFATCLESQKVDSAVTWVRREPDSLPEPLKKKSEQAYFPGSCMVRRIVSTTFYPTPKIVTIDFTLRPDGRTADYVMHLNMETIDTARGTFFYSERGEVDSALAVEVLFRNGAWVVKREKDRTLHLPGYDLIQVFSQHGDSVWKAQQSDSIVADDSGTTVYSRDAGSTEVRRCAAQGPEFTCEPRQGTLNRMVWFAEGERADSSRVYDLENHLLSETHFYWSGKDAGLVRRGVLRRTPTQGGDLFNLLGRWVAPRSRISQVTYPPGR